MARRVTKSGGKKNRKFGRQRRSPSFARYWAACGGRGRRFDRKVRNLQRRCGMTEKEAYATLTK